MKIVECVPNISEGKRHEVWEAASKAAASVKGVELLNVDPGAETNRTVITFVGDPEAVLEGAFRLIETATKLIDMSTHKGAHPRMGAVDVCPFVPVSDMTMDECAELARRLGARVGSELGIPIYLYEFAASSPERQNLATIRAGEYEALARKLADPKWKPDFGPAEFNAKTGATAIGARKFLVAYNVNLNVTDTRLANRVAFDVRERGRVRRDENDRKVLDGEGNEIWDPGMLKAVKGVGWMIPEFGCAQVSMNLTDLDVTPLHVAFDACDERARARGMRVTGSELVGLVPLKVLLDAGRHYRARTGRTTGIPEKELVHAAVRTLGLNEVKEFDAKELVIEYRLRKPGRLVSMSLHDFTDELSSDSPAPGGGSVSALAGAMAAGLASMVAALSHAKKGFEKHQADHERIGVRAQEIKDELLRAVDADTDAFDMLLEAMRMPKGSAEEKAARNEAMTDATVLAIEVPLGVLELCPEVIELCREVAKIGLEASLSDAGVGVQMARAAAAGAYQNVCINMAGLGDRETAASLTARADVAWERAKALHAAGEEEILGALRSQAKA
jgi:glutamate formiminotransferase/formiminotetrahydrofolate cyclodeaminase